MKHKLQKILGPIGVLVGFLRLITLLLGEGFKTADFVLHIIFAVLIAGMLYVNLSSQETHFYSLFSSIGFALIIVFLIMSFASIGTKFARDIIFTVAFMADFIDFHQKFNRYLGCEEPR